MGLGKHVRITRPPKGHEVDWLDQTATVLSLIPRAANPLTYKIQLDNDGSEHIVSADCLEPTKFVEERQEGDFGYLIVNDCMYCLEHRLEVCGQCSVDHRLTNLQVEIDEGHVDGEVGYDVIDTLLDDLKRTGVKGRVAPTKKSKAKHNAPANTAPFKPVINDCLVLSCIKNATSSDSNNNNNNGGFNPTQTLSVRTTEHLLRAHSQFPMIPIPEEMKLPLRRVRETIVVAGRQWDTFLATNSSHEPMMRIFLQDEAQSQVLNLDLVLPIRCVQDSVTNQPIPLFVVRYARVLASNMTNVMAILGTMPKGTKMCEIPVKVDEIEFMTSLLDENSKHLDPAFVRKVQKYPEFLSVSFFTSISQEMEDEFYRSIIDLYCWKCGTSKVPIQKCVRCMKAGYCSRQCQRLHWKYHKNNSCA
jgi:MYND finger